MRFPGIIPAVTTPFAASGAIDTAALQANVTALLDAGVHGIVADRHHGRGGQPELRERSDVVAAIAEAVEGRVSVIAGVSAGTPAQDGAYAADAAGAGAIALIDDAARLPRRRGEIAAFYGAVAGRPACRSWPTTNPRHGRRHAADLIAR